MRAFNPLSTLLTFIVVLFVFLIMAASLIIFQQQELLQQAVRDRAEQQLDLMADASFEALLKSDYVTVRTFVKRWGEATKEIHQIRAVTPNGFVLAEYRQPVVAAVGTYVLAKKVVIGTTELVTFHMVGDFSQVDKIAAQLKVRLLLGSLLITILLGGVLWFVFRKMALLPLEAMVEERTVELRSELAEREMVEHSLREQKEHLGLILQSMAEGIYGVDLRGNCTFCNPAGLRILGYEEHPEELIGKKIHSLIHHTRPDGTRYPAEECKIYCAYREGKGFHGVGEVFWRADGTCFPVEYWAQPIMRDGVAIGAVTAFVDITEQRKLEEQLHQAQKMESIGILAGGVAHDFNNILTAIIGYGNLALMKMATDDSFRPNIVNILEAADRASHLTKDLLLFSRKRALDRKSLDLNSSIRKMERFLLRVIGEDIAFKTILYDDVLPVMADIHQLEQVLVNIAINARDAMPKGGIFTMRTAQITLDEQFVRHHGHGKPGIYAVISAEDSGKGMSKETRQRIFEPFFTTKDMGKGTGLGLAVVYGIVQQHDGFINVYSEPGAGTTFKIFLPLIAASESEESSAGPGEFPVGGTETILLAEDDDTLRAMMQSVLSEFGYTVIAAVDGQEAVEKFIADQDRIDLLLFDLVMPKMSGKEAYDEIVKVKKGIRTIFASGYSPDIIHEKTSPGEIVTIVYKPISPTDLLRKIRSILDEGKKAAQPT